MGNIVHPMVANIYYLFFHYLLFIINYLLFIIYYLLFIASTSILSVASLLALKENVFTETILVLRVPLSFSGPIAMLLK